MIVYYTGPVSCTNEHGEWKPGDKRNLPERVARLLMRKNRWMTTEEPKQPKPKAKAKATKEEVGKDE